MPQRIQLSRAKGYRKPEGAIVVSRPSRWGNPIRITPERDERGQQWYRVHGSPMDRNGGPAYVGLDTARFFAARFFEWDLLNGRFGDRYPTVEEIARELAGHDLACWCPLRFHRNGTAERGYCHADVLLDLASRDLEEIYQ